MRITERQLRSIIKEEYLRTTPVRPGMLMSEARAEYLAEEMLDEGLWSSLKAGVAGAVGGVGAALKPFGNIASAAANLASKGAEAASKAIEELKDDVQKKAAESARESLKKSITSAIQSASATAIKDLVAAKMPEPDAKAFVAGLCSSALETANA